MTISTGHELFVFFSFFVCGQIIFVIFDMFRAIRKSFHVGNTFVGIQDILFLAIAFLALQKCVLTANYGEIRWYEILSFAGSGILYFLLESCYIMRFFKCIIKALIKIFTPVINILKKGFNIIMKLANKTQNLVKPKFLSFFVKKFKKRS